MRCAACIKVRLRNKRTVPFSEENADIVVFNVADSEIGDAVTIKISRYKRIWIMADCRVRSHGREGSVAVAEQNAQGCDAVVRRPKREVRNSASLKSAVAMPIPSGPVTGNRDPEKLSPAVPELTATFPSTELLLVVSTKETDPVGAGIPAELTIPATVAVSVYAPGIPACEIVVIVGNLPVTASAAALDTLDPLLFVPRNTAL